MGSLPGTDPALADQPVLLIAHLDGYGFGTPVNGDALYNGTFDNAAYQAKFTNSTSRWPNPPLTLTPSRSGRQAALIGPLRRVSPAGDPLIRTPA